MLDLKRIIHIKGLVFAVDRTFGNEAAIYRTSKITFPGGGTLWIPESKCVVVARPLGADVGNGRETNLFQMDKAIFEVDFCEADNNGPEEIIAYGPNTARDYDDATVKFTDCGHYTQLFKHSDLLLGIPYGAVILIGKRLE